MPICVRCDELGTGMLCQECLRLSLKLGSLAMEAMAIDNAADASREANRGRIPPHLYEWHSITVHNLTLSMEEVARHRAWHAELKIDNHGPLPGL